MAQLTEFGKAVKHELLERGESQSWLIELVKQNTGLFCDSSYMSKILHGGYGSPKIIEAIREILDLQKGEE